MDKKVDLLKILSYPLTPFPHSLANMDGSIISNNSKGEITSLLMSGIDENETSIQKTEVEIIDGFYFMSTQRDTPSKYGQFASFILKRICDTSAREIHIIFDKNEGPSLKDVDIKKKVYEDLAHFEIKGPNQERNGNLQKNLRNNNFKSELVSFLINCWANNEISSAILGDKRLFLSYGSQCYLFSNDYEKRKEISNFQNNHIDIETKMIMHMYKIVAKHIIIKTSTTDTLLVYLLYHMQFWPIEREIWIQTGEIHKNTIRMINVDQIYRHSTPHFLNALPAWYVFCGCSYEPSFYGKGKKSCLKTLEKKMEYQRSFGALGNHQNVTEDDIATLEEFACQLYSTNEKSVNKARVKIFENCYRSKIATDKIQDFGKNGNNITIFNSFFS